MNMTHFLMIFSTLCVKNKDVSIEKTFDQLSIVTSFPVICHIFQFWIRFVFVFALFFKWEERMGTKFKCFLTILISLWNLWNNVTRIPHDIDKHFILKLLHILYYGHSIIAIEFYSLIFSHYHHVFFILVVANFS